jgi:hypothetical protein
MLVQWAEKEQGDREIASLKFLNVEERTMKTTIQGISKEISMLEEQDLTRKRG